MQARPVRALPAHVVDLFQVPKVDEALVLVPRAHGLLVDDPVVRGVHLVQVVEEVAAGDLVRRLQEVEPLPERPVRTVSPAQDPRERQGRVGRGVVDLLCELITIGMSLSSLANVPPLVKCLFCDNLLVVVPHVVPSKLIVRTFFGLKSFIVVSFVVKPTSSPNSDLGGLFTLVSLSLDPSSANASSPLISDLFIL